MKFLHAPPRWPRAHLRTSRCGREDGYFWITGEDMSVKWLGCSPYQAGPRTPAFAAESGPDVLILERLRN